jgi:hypothetical protein
MRRRVAVNFEDFRPNGELDVSHPHYHSEQRDVPNVASSSLESVQFDAGLLSEAIVNLANSYGDRRNSFLQQLRAALTHGSN